MRLTNFTCGPLCPADPTIGGRLGAVGVHDTREVEATTAVRLVRAVQPPGERAHLEGDARAVRDLQDGDPLAPASIVVPDHATGLKYARKCCPQNDTVHPDGCAEHTAPSGFKLSEFRTDKPKPASGKGKGGKSGGGGKGKGKNSKKKGGGKGKGKNKAK